MPIRFVIGRAGTGKTHRCFRAIVDAIARDPLGPPVYWIVPKQASFQAERELTCNSDLDGFCRVHVVSFEQLGEQVLACVENCRLIQQADVYVDGFHEFTDFERRTLAGIAKVCAKIEITLLLDPASVVVKDPHTLPDDMSLFHRTEDTYRRLWFTFHEEGIEIAPPVLLTETKRFSNPYLL